MKKLIKNMSLLVIALLMACCLAVGFAACGDDSSSSGSSGSGSGNNSNQKTTYTDASGVETKKFEAEYTDLNDNTYGARSYVGYSQNVEYPIIAGTGSDNCSGYYVSQLYINEAFVVFEIESDSEAEAEMYLSLSMAQECSDKDQYTQTLSSSQFTVYTNKRSSVLSHGDLEFDMSGLVQNGEYNAFKEYDMGSFTLQEGTNVIILEVSNQYKSGSAGGSMSAIAPLIDYMRLDTEATLTWNEKRSNLNNV